MRVGFVGLGRMGVPMARNILAAGHEVLVHGRDRDAVDALCREGASPADGFRDLAAGVDALCSCRVTPDQSLATFIGEDGAVAHARPGTLCIDFATIDPMTSRRIAERLREAGLGFLDAPVSGGPDGAAFRTLSVMAGGTEADFARGRPVFEAIAATVLHMGPSGSGVTTKLCNNLVTGTLHVLLAEAMVLGTKAGIDSHRLYEALHASSARSRTLERVGPHHFLPRNFEPASALAMIIKDLDCALVTARAHGVRLLLPAVAQQCFVEAAGLGYGEDDLSAVIRPMEAIAGVEVGRADPGRASPAKAD